MGDRVCPLDVPETVQQQPLDDPDEQDRQARGGEERRAREVADTERDPGEQDGEEQAD